MRRYVTTYKSSDTKGDGIASGRQETLYSPRHWAKSRSVAGSIPDGVTVIFH